MARPPRLNIPGATYHVMNRGNRKALLFEDDRDRRRFIRLLSDTAAEFAVEVLADCLMGNHVHLVIVTPAGNVSQFMQQLEGKFAEYSNWRHQRVGHVFQGRFKSVIVDNDIHLLTAIVYVLMNPIVAGYVKQLEEWKWSSYRAIVGLDSAPGYLSLSWLDELFPTDTRSGAQRAFRAFINEAEPIQAYVQQSEPVFGSASLKRVIRSYVGQRLYGVNVPRSLRALARPTLEELFKVATGTLTRAQTIQRAHVVHGYKYEEIARTLGLHPTTVSKIVRRLRRQAMKVGCQGQLSGSDPDPESQDSGSDPS